MAVQVHAPEQASLIKLRGVSKDYETAAGAVPVLRDISIQVGQGEFVSVVGPSGSGKSTLLNMITGIDRPTGGEVRVAGSSLHELSENQLARWRARNVGIIFQFFQLLPTLTVLENVLLPMDFAASARRRNRGRSGATLSRRARRNRALDLLAQVGIAEQAHKLPNALSGGQQQRAAIARALANDPPLIVGDEPTGNLDSATAGEVSTLFEDLVAQGKTLLIVTHDLGLSARSGRVLHLLDGQLQRDEQNGNGRG